MKLLFLDVNQTETATKITKLNTFQQVGIAMAYKDLGHDVYIGRFNKTDYSPLNNYEMNISNDLNEFDVVFLTNYVLNFFGGQEIPSMTKSFKLLHNFKGRIIYLLSDFEMKLKQYEPRDEWVGEHNNEDYKINNYEIAVQTFNKELTEKYLEHKVHYFPIQYATFYKNLQSSEAWMKLTDLIYCGSFRSGRREKKMKHYFFDTLYDVELFGNIKLEQFDDDYQKAPTFLNKVSVEDVSQQNQDGYATIVIGDNSYNNHFFTMRILEAIRDNLILFIDNDYDEQHILDFNYFHYVRNKEELFIRIKMIKEDEELYNNLLKEQWLWFKNRFTDKMFLEKCKELLENEN